MQKNARQHVQDVSNQLQTCRNSLTQAISTVEKQQNRQKIQSTLDAVNSAIQAVNTTLSTYQE